MTDRDELRRLAEAVLPDADNEVGRWYDKEWLVADEYADSDAVYIAAVDPQTVLALLDAADQRDRATAGLIAVRRELSSGRTMTRKIVEGIQDVIEIALASAEVDRAE